MIGIVIITVIAFVGGTSVGEAEDGGLHIFFLFFFCCCYVLLFACLSLISLSSLSFILINYSFLHPLFLQDGAVLHLAGESLSAALCAALLLSTLLLVVGGLLFAVASDLADELEEGLFDVDAGLGGGLHEGAADRLAQLAALGGGDLALGLEIALVAEDDDGDGVGVLHAEDLVAEARHFVKAGAGGDTVHAQEALARPHVLISHRRVLFLPRGIEDVEQAGLFVDNHLLAVRIFNRRVVLVQKVVLNQLNRQRALSHTTSSNNNQFVFRHILL